jgi:hypothetical protein
MDDVASQRPALEQISNGVSFLKGYAFQSRVICCGPLALLNKKFLTVQATNALRMRWMISRYRLVDARVGTFQGYREAFYTLDIVQSQAYKEERIRHCSSALGDFVMH